VYAVFVLCAVAANCRLMGGKRYPLWVRRMAVEAWVLAGKPPSESMAVAVELFQAMLPVEDRPRNAHDFIVTWTAGWKKRGSVRSKSPSPRRRILDDDTARRCIDALLKGYKVNKQQRYYRSFRDAVAKNPVIKQVLASHTTERGKHEGGPISPFYLWRRMKEVDPSLSRHTLRYVHQRTRAQERERVAYCRRLLAMSPAQRKRYLSRVVWIDSKLLYVVPVDQFVYAPPNSQLVVEDARIPASWRRMKKINYYVAVNAALGGVAFRPVTGTTDWTKIFREYYPSFNPYKVRIPSYPYEFVPLTKWQWGFSLTCPTAHCMSAPHCCPSA
jgi:hypothetical protein